MHEIEVRYNVDEGRLCAEMAMSLRPMLAELEKASICNKLYWGIRCERHFGDPLSREIRRRELKIIDMKSKEEVEDRRKAAEQRQLSLKRAFDAAEQAIKELASILTSDEPQPSASGGQQPGPSTSNQYFSRVTLDSDDD
ncbi:hypothetical protein AAVH_23452 [Aphelenchoides avenae]|nr:hypothetical protein AAVH_23452 [Aphelenchus avenae]